MNLGCIWIQDLLVQNLLFLFFFSFIKSLTRTVLENYYFSCSSYCTCNMAKFSLLCSIKQHDISGLIDLILLTLPIPSPFWGKSWWINELALLPWFMFARGVGKNRFNQINWPNQTESIDLGRFFNWIWHVFGLVLVLEIKKPNLLTPTMSLILIYT